MRKRSFPQQCSLETDAQGAFRQQPGLNASPGQNSRACTEWSPGAGQPNMMYVQGHLADWALASMRRDTDKAMGKEPLIFFRSLLWSSLGQRRCWNSKGNNEHHEAVVTRDGPTTSERSDLDSCRIVAFLEQSPVHIKSLEAVATAKLFSL